MSGVNISIHGAPPTHQLGLARDPLLPPPVPFIPASPFLPNLVELREGLELAGVPALAELIDEIGLLTACRHLCRWQLPRILAGAF